MRRTAITLAKPDVVDIAPTSQPLPSKPLDKHSTPID
jgi:hypothetical protein